MSFDLKLASICYSLAATVIFVLGAAWLIRRIIDGSFARAGHGAYVLLTRGEPKCDTCPFRGRCPYSGGVLCHFTGMHVIQSSEKH